MKLAMGEIGSHDMIAQLVTTSTQNLVVMD